MNLPYSAQITGWSVNPAGDTRLITVQIVDSFNNPSGQPYTMTDSYPGGDFGNMNTQLQNCISSQLQQDAALLNPQDPIGGLLTAVQGQIIKLPG